MNYLVSRFQKQPQSSEKCRSELWERLDGSQKKMLDVISSNIVSERDFLLHVNRKNNNKETIFAVDNLPELRI